MGPLGPTAGSAGRDQQSVSDANAIGSMERIFGLLCQVARLDGPHERNSLERAAEALSIAPQDWYAHAES